MPVSPHHAVMVLMQRFQFPAHQLQINSKQFCASVRLTEPVKVVQIAGLRQLAAYVRKYHIGILMFRVEGRWERTLHGDDLCDAIRLSQPYLFA